MTSYFLLRVIRRIPSTCLVGCFFLLLIPVVYGQRVEDWVPVEGFKVEVDTTGWEFPVEIAFVPNPGNQPDDPLYYVSELRGTIKVVTRNRQVLTYAENVNSYRPPAELPSETAELGLAGICLDPQNGYLFATTIYYKDRLLYNKIVRFEHETHQFALKPKKTIEFTDFFGTDESAISHQIGKCTIGKDHLLYVGVGDGQQAFKSQGLSYSNGKILRMHLDGSAVVTNPFYDANSPRSITGYVYAYGFRNPFGIALDSTDQPYVADNGPNWDRLVEVIAGKNYLWDGTNMSMRVNGIYDWQGSVGPAGVIYLGTNSVIPQWKNRLVVAQGGTMGEPGPSRKGKITLNSFPVQKGLGVVALPETLVSYKGQYQQLLVPVSEGPDGIYFSGFFPTPEGVTSILKLVPGHSSSAPASASAEMIMEQIGCAGCHQIQGVGGSKGPALDGLVDRLRLRMVSKEYLAELDAVDQYKTPLHQGYQEARQKLRQLKGDEQIAFWISMRLKEPRFDREQSQMPNFQLSDEKFRF